jgi:ornithine carbamoyltransferase
MDISIACPTGYMPNEEITANAKIAAKGTGSVITITNDPHDAIKDADIAVTDVWTSMGQEEETESG